MSEVLEVRPPTMSVDAMIENYVKLRDKKKVLEDRHKLELLPVKEMMDRLEGWLLELLNNTRLDSVKSAHGTAYKTIRTSATISDFEAFLDYVRSNNAWDLLERRVAKIAAMNIIKETGEPIPGVDTSMEVCVNVRRAGEKAPVGK